MNEGQVRQDILYFIKAGHDLHVGLTDSIERELKYGSKWNYDSLELLIAIEGSYQKLHWIADRFCDYTDSCSLNKLPNHIAFYECADDESFLEFIEHLRQGFEPDYTHLHGVGSFSVAEWSAFQTLQDDYTTLCKYDIASDKNFFDKLPDKYREAFEIWFDMLAEEDK